MGRLFDDVTARTVEQLDGLPFKVGDRVRVIQAEMTWLAPDKIYTVIAVYPSVHRGIHPTISVEGAHNTVGQLAKFFVTRFEKVEGV